MRLISSQLAEFFRNENFQINSCEYGIISKIFAPSKEIKVLQIKNLGIMAKEIKMYRAGFQKNFRIKD